MNPIVRALENAGYRSLPYHSKNDLQEEYAEKILQKFIEAKTNHPTRGELKKFIKIQLEEYLHKRSL